MKSKLLLIAFGITLVCSWYAFAAADYAQIKKDISVMSQIVKGALKADPDCKQCRVSINGKYLAEQGVIFLIKGHSAGYSLIHIDGDNEYSYSYTFDDQTLRSFESLQGLEALEGLESLESLQGLEALKGLESLESLEHLPEMLSEIIASVSSSAIPDSQGVEFARIIRIVDDTTRESLREIRRARRDLIQEIRENEIEMIHIEEADQRQLEASIREMEEQVRALEDQQRVIAKEAQLSRQEYQKKRDEQRHKKFVVRQAQRELMQRKVLAAFCDYGTTLRSLPPGEKVTLIFENSSEEDTIMVFDRNEVTTCDRGKEDLKKQAITYNF